MPTPPVALAVGGSDSGAGAGIQADLKSFAARGVFGTTAITVVTAQNTVALQRAFPVTTDVVVAQVEAVLDDFDVAAVKTGMLGRVELVSGLARLAAARRLPNLVVDPVLVNGAGAALFDADVVAAYRELLFPHAVVVTPNIDEAALLTGTEVGTVAEMMTAAEMLASLGPRYVVVKGGRLDGDAIDVVVGEGETHHLSGPRVATANNHGTGCSLASTIAGGLARGESPLDAIAAAKDFVRRAINGAVGWQLGEGHGPIDHFGWGT